MKSLIVSTNYEVLSGWPIEGGWDGRGM